MASKITDFLVDKRIVERNIDKGLLTKKDYDQHISALADREDNAEIVDFEAQAEEAAEAEQA
jgi:hypothetical protein